MNTMSSEKRQYELRARARRQAETRRRIVEATVALHEEVGPARTTVSEIARRAGVQRLTVYNHFPDDAGLFAACQLEFLTRHPPPDLSPALALGDPRGRVQAALETLYASYAAREPMTAKVLRDRTVLPAMDSLLRRTVDAQLAQLVDTLAAGFKARGERPAGRLRAVLVLAVDFWTWQRLMREGVDSTAAAVLMADLATAAVHSRYPSGGS